MFNMSQIIRHIVSVGALCIFSKRTPAILVPGSSYYIKILIFTGFFIVKADSRSRLPKTVASLRAQ